VVHIDKKEQRIDDSLTSYDLESITNEMIKESFDEDKQAEDCKIQTERGLDECEWETFSLEV
jgi:hypothetical protein